MSVGIPIARQRLSIGSSPKALSVVLEDSKSLEDYNISITSHIVLEDWHETSISRFVKDLMDTAISHYGVNESFIKFGLFFGKILAKILEMVLVNVSSLTFNLGSFLIILFLNIVSISASVVLSSIIVVVI